MKLPGFSAESSVYTSRLHYHCRLGASGKRSSDVSPALLGLPFPRLPLCGPCSWNVDLGGYQQYCWNPITGEYFWTPCTWRFQSPYLSH